jgi:hypothetical protein
MAPSIVESLMAVHHFSSLRAGCNFGHSTHGITQARERDIFVPAQDHHPGKSEEISAKSRSQTRQETRQSE